MKQLVDIINSKAFTVLVCTVCGVFVLTEVKKAIIEIKDANLPLKEK